MAADPISRINVQCKSHGYFKTDVSLCRNFTFVQVTFSLSLLSQRCACTLVRFRHKKNTQSQGNIMAWLKKLIATITDSDGRTSSEKYPGLVAPNLWSINLGHFWWFIETSTANISIIVANFPLYTFQIAPPCDALGETYFGPTSSNHTAVSRWCCFVSRLFRPIVSLHSGAQSHVATPCLALNGFILSSQQLGIFSMSSVRPGSPRSPIDYSYQSIITLHKNYKKYKHS